MATQQFPVSTAAQWCSSMTTIWDQGSNVLTAQYETPHGETIEVIVSNGRQLVVNEDGDYELRYQVRCEVS